MIDLKSALDTRQFFRFTGPPEHWLTAIKLMTWGLEIDLKDRWQKIQTGDIFFIHSTGAQNSVFPNARSGIIGIGVVGYGFSTKENFIWHYEFKNNINRWPLLIPLTEIYLFSELSDLGTWESPTPQNDDQTTKLIDQLITNRVPISEIKGFPQMGSFSSVSRDVAEQILFKNKPLYLFSGHSKREIMAPRLSSLHEVKNASETLRNAASLRFIDAISKRLILKQNSLIERDNDILARAETVHHSITQELIDLFRHKGYATLSNEFVDLFVHNEKRSFLFEVKSTENKNFRSQARKGIVQLLEYDFFEINKFKEENQIDFVEEYKILVPSKQTKDRQYVSFINSLELGLATVEGGKINPIGKDFGFSSV